LIPRLGSSDPNHFVLVVTNIEVEMREEFGFRQRVGRVNAKKRLRPRCINTRIGSDLDPTADAQSVRYSRIAARRQLKIALMVELAP